MIVILLFVYDFESTSGTQISTLEFFDCSNETASTTSDNSCIVHRLKLLLTELDQNAIYKAQYAIRNGMNETRKIKSSQAENRI